MQAIDKQGLPYTIYITNVSDRAGALEAFSLYRDNLTEVDNILTDGGYSGENFASAVRTMLGCTVEKNATNSTPPLSFPNVG